LENDEILRMIWGFKKKGKIIDNIHSFSGNMADAVIKYSMKKLSVDNVTVIFIAFENFEEKKKEENFEYNYS
jgi:predicted tellurium resistance membrane protein TerC